MSMEMDMEKFLGDDLIQMPFKEESEGHNNGLLEQVCGPVEEFDDLLTELPFTKDFDTLRVPKKIHKFYFVKLPATSEDPSLKIRIKEAEKIIQRQNQARAPIDEKLKEKKIKSLCYRIQHGAKSLSEEKKLLGEMKQMEAEKKKVIVDTDLKPNIPNYLDTEEAIQDHFEGLSNELNRQKKVHLEYNVIVKRLKRELEEAERDIGRLEKKIEDINREKNEAYRCLVQLERQIDEEDSIHPQLVSLLNDAKDLTETKNVRALKESSSMKQVELLMSQWKLEWQQLFQ
ncbi:Proton pump-interactor like [Actinidia chinensis var. chinensis]|uniref:Proton pump-interactor like n=1 Tax=Actinidia chinensis var. chinensis TaxID=1590841 RepID=A0A2R6QC48_ACTCC|nr:Proton pump-interactor like [Actinidia chinensis var. chinensis]